MVEEAGGGGLESGGALAGGGAELGGGDGGVVKFAGVAYVPAFEAFGGDFGMELQGEGVASDGEGLIGVEMSLGEVDGVGGKVEGVAVPMEDGQVVGEEWGEPGGRVGVGGGLERGPADFCSVVAGIDAGAESGGHELRAETDAEDGFLGLDAAGDESDFFFEKGVVVVVVDADGAAEDY